MTVQDKIEYIKVNIARSQVFKSQYGEKLNSLTRLLPAFQETLIDKIYGFLLIELK